jgi:hypothetical protein
MNDFFERAIALRNQYIIENDPLKDFKIEILSQIIAQFFRFEKIPYCFSFFSFSFPLTGNNLSPVIAEILSSLSLKYDFPIIREEYNSSASHYFVSFSETKT